MAPSKSVSENEQRRQDGIDGGLKSAVQFRFRGRCFNCRKWGHMSRNCSIARSSRSSRPVQRLRLSDLPPEILELICGHLICRSKWIPYGFPGFMHELRLTCRLIEAKTHDFFCTMAFRRIALHLDSHGLSRLTAISNHEDLASKVQLIFINNEDRGLSAHEFEDAVATSHSTTVSASERHEAAEKVYSARCEQADKSFFERSATDGIILVSAFRRFPNLRSVYLPATRFGENFISIRRLYSGEGQSTNHIFAMVLSCLAYANLRPKEISMDLWDGHGFNIEGVSISALELYHPLTECLSELETLELRLDINIRIYECQMTWQNHLAVFLQLCPKLRRLGLYFNKEAKSHDAAIVFRNVAAKVQLKHLEKFSLHNVRCNGDDLREFLRCHRFLQSLELVNLEINGATPFGSVLQLLETTHTKLESFRCRQITENSYRLYLETLGKIEVVKGEWASCFFSDSDLELEFFADFETVKGPYKYLFEAEEWEGVQQKIKLIREDLRVSEILYPTDTEVQILYWGD